ncbi:MAG: hypothetical protein ABEJ90_02820 [Halobacterium sp.]
MHRRTFLAATATAAGASLAGCSLPGRTRLDDPRVDESDDQTDLVYREGDERVTAITVQTRFDRQPPYRMQHSIWHREGTTVDDLRIAVRPRGPRSITPEVYLAAPGSDFPPIRFSVDRDTNARVFEIPGIDAVGEGTVTLSWYLHTFDTDPPVAVDVGTNDGLDAGPLGGYDVVGETTATLVPADTQN